MNKPIIGISTGMLVDKDKQFAGNEKIYVNRDYVEAVIKSGGVPIMLPLDENLENVKSQVDLVDGIIITGGNDVSPYNYNQEPHQLLKATLPMRDDYELELIRIAKQKNIPILGICRGHQLLNVFEGGTLYQDISLINKEALRHWQKEAKYIKTQKVNINADSILSKIYDTELMVNTFHHQVIDELGEDFKVIAAASDGIIEAIEHTSYPFMLGIQWHPEMLHTRCKRAQDLFTLFVNACKEG